jgi:arylsulfatase A-like enzyme
MTGFQPATHGCNRNDTSLAPSYATLAERLRDEGFDTAAVVSHVFLGKRFGLHQGFTHWDQELVLRSDAESHAAISSPEVTDKGLAWLREYREQHSQDSAGEAVRPWFLWLHYFDPHYLYQPHPDLESSFGGEGFVDLYDGEIAFTDRHLGRLFEGLERLDLMDDTAVLIVADHGEELQDHGGMFHRKTLYEEVVRIPLILRAPALPAGGVATPISLVDVPATLLDLLGLEPMIPQAGRSFLPLVGAPASVTPAPILIELVQRDRELASVVEGRWKLVVDYRDGRSQLFELDADPKEQRNLADEQPDREQALRRRLESLREEARTLAEGLDTAGHVELPDDEKRAMQQLGYAGEDEEDED